ncbi:hypothetical protein B0T21DRAFT_441915 [Apiosordaria backusii]|uniref:Uncharacterized protein n=1 Tax=Apiosordaria backusii TaxID=314023 RepID=A0AA40BJQ0_9PEZI|nr:hypothetical protein B0T21DRAFT_441915 [Apiosordaria backusii]
MTVTMESATTTSRTASFSLALPHSLDNRIYVRLSLKSKALVVFLTTAAPEEADQATPLGSFVFALPDRYNPSQPLSTALCTVEPTIEFTTRMAKLLVRKMGNRRPVYVGNSISFQSTGLGGVVEEEMEGFGAVMNGIMGVLKGWEEEEEEEGGQNGIREGVEGLRVSS